MNLGALDLSTLTPNTGYACSATAAGSLRRRSIGLAGVAGSKAAKWLSRCGKALSLFIRTQND